MVWQGSPALGLINLYDFSIKFSKIKPMNKQIIFNKELVPLIKSGQKTTTWRLTDRQDLQKDDVVDLINRGNNMAVFAIARLIDVKITTFNKLTASDKAGHEEFSSDEEMYQTYSGYYHINVTPVTRLKVVKFKIERFL